MHVLSYFHYLTSRRYNDIVGLTNSLSEFGGANYASYSS